MKRNVTAEFVREHLDYCPETGVFTRRTSGFGWIAGTTAGCVGAQGYVKIGLGRRMFTAHRLAWLWMTGSWPLHQLDHKDRDRTNNRWWNLRLATNKQNAENKRPYGRSGVKGVYASGRKWEVRITSNYRERAAFGFESKDLAAEFRGLAEQMLFTHGGTA